MRKIPIMIPYFNEQENEAVIEVLKSGWVAQGPKVAKFEELVAKHEDSCYGVAVTSCTSALHLALVAIGIGKGDDVLLPSFTFIATANAVVYTGAVPVFTDIDLSTYNISINNVMSRIDELYSWDEDKKSLLNKSTGNILRAIIPVHLFGLCADIYKINEIAKKYNISILEDSACALGAKIENTHQGNFGNPSCLSFHPRKSITTGEGGMVLTSDKKFAEQLYQLRSHGASVSEINRHKKGGFLLPDFEKLGYNYRMTDIQAAVGIAQINKFDWILNERRKKAENYNELLSNINWLIPPYVPVGYFHTYQSYVCMLDITKTGHKTIEEANVFRNELMYKLEECGIATRQGTHAVHTLEYYKNKFSMDKKYCINAYKADRLSITLPLYVQMTAEDQQYVIEKIIDIKNQF